MYLLSTYYSLFYKKKTLKAIIDTQFYYTIYLTKKKKNHKFLAKYTKRIITQTPNPPNPTTTRAMPKQLPGSKARGSE